VAPVPGMHEPDIHHTVVTYAPNRRRREVLENVREHQVVPSDEGCAVIPSVNPPFLI
jgi:hypothetical protein